MKKDNECGSSNTFSHHFLPRRNQAMRETTVFPRSVVNFFCSYPHIYNINVNITDPDPRALKERPDLSY